MRARIKPAAITSKSQRRAIKQLAAEELRGQAEGNVRRTIKLLCLALHEEFGFGAKRLGRLVQQVNRLGEVAAKDEVFWTHVDRVMRQIGMDFQDENYEEVDD